MPNINDRLFDAVMRLTVISTRFDSNVQRRLKAYIAGYSSDLAQLIDRAPNLGRMTGDRQRLAMSAIIKEGNAAITEAHRAMRADMGKQLSGFAKVQGRSVVQQFNEVFDVALFEATENLAAVAAQDVVLGLPANEWWTKQGASQRSRWAAEIRIGSLAGESNEDIVRRVVGKRTGKRVFARVGAAGRKLVNEYTGGITDQARFQVRALVRTSVQSLNNAVLERTYQNNSDVVEAMEAVATLDARTTDICIARDGGIWDMEGRPTKDSATDESYPGPPPWHMQCRTVIVPVVADLKELAKDAGLKPKLDQIPKGTRATMDGQVPENVKAGDWLNRKGDKFGRELLGRGRYDLWKDGKITLQQLIDQSGRPLTLAQLEELVNV